MGTPITENAAPSGDEGRRQVSSSQQRMEVAAETAHTLTTPKAAPTVEAAGRAARDGASAVAGRVRRHDG